MRPIPYVSPDPQGWLAKFRFSIPIKARYCETDVLGHVNNVFYFAYFEQGRVEYLESVGVAETLFGEERISVTADLECQFLAQVYLKDPLRLHVRTAKLGRSSFDIEYALVHDGNGELKATGRGAMVFIDRASGRSTPLPDDVRAKLAHFENSR